MATKSKWSPNKVGEAGHRALELATEHKDDLEERLPAGALNGLTADLATYEGKVSEAKRAPNDLAALTRNQNAAAAAGMALVSAVRESVVRNGASKAQRKDFGVGAKATVGNVSSVIAGLDAIISGAAKHPELARLAGILTSEVDKAKALRAALATADAAQERKKESRKTPVAERNAAARRIAATVDTIVGVALVRYCDNPALAERFRALIPSRRRKRGPGSGGGTPPV